MDSFLQFADPMLASAMKKKVAAQKAQAALRVFDAATAHQRMSEVQIFEIRRQIEAERAKEISRDERRAAPAREQFRAMSDAQRVAFLARQGGMVGGATRF